MICVLIKNVREDLIEERPQLGGHVLAGPFALKLRCEANIESTGLVDEQRACRNLFRCLFRAV